MLIAILAQTRSLADEPVVPIKLKAGAFTPGVDDQSPPDSLTLDSYEAGTEGYYLLQFRGAVQQSWKDDAIALGAEFLGYIPENAFKVRMTPEQAELIARLDSVHWLGLWQPAYKVSPSADDVDMRLYKVRIESGANTAAVLEQITTLFPGLQHDSGPYVILPANSEQVQLLAHILDVAWIEPYQLPEKHNEAGGGVIMGSALANANGYDGSTQIVAVADTGLGDGTAAGAHPDIPASRISGIFNWPGSSSGCFRSITDDGSQDVDSGHGTHVSTSVLGDGGTGGVGKGVASAASLVFQSTENYATVTRFCARFYGYVDGYYLTGLPDDTMHPPILRMTYFSGMDMECP